MIKCNCGHRVIARDVLQTGYYLSLFGPSFVYVRFRCSRCKRVGEQLVQEEKWDPSILSQPVGELSDRERKRFEEMGPIRPDEVVDFHFALEQLTALPEDLGSSRK